MDLLMNRILNVLNEMNLVFLVGLIILLLLLRRIVRGETWMFRVGRRGGSLVLVGLIGYVLIRLLADTFGFAAGEVQDVFVRVMLIVLFAYVGWEAVELAVSVLKSRWPRYEAVDERRVVTIGNVVRWTGRVVILFSAAAMMLDVFDINIAPLLTGAGVVGLAVGLGAQKLVQDFIAGIFILLEDQFHVGDGVEIAGISGVVEEMTLRVTKVRDFNGILHIIPNSEISTVSNKTRDWARAIAEVGVAYDSDLGHVLDVLTEVGKTLYEENPDNIFLEPPIPLGPEALADSSINFRLVARVKGGQQWTAQRIMRRRIKEAFDRAGIEIPFPQVDVHMREA